MNDLDNMFEKLRLNVTIPARVVEEVDNLAKEYGATRSAMITSILKTYLDQQKSLEIGTIYKAMEELVAKLEEIKMIDQHKGEETTN